MDERRREQEGEEGLEALVGRFRVNGWLDESSFVRRVG